MSMSSLFLLSLSSLFLCLSFSSLLMPLSCSCFLYGCFVPSFSLFSLSHFHFLFCLSLPLSVLFSHSLSWTTNLHGFFFLPLRGPASPLMLSLLSSLSSHLTPSLLLALPNSPFLSPIPSLPVLSSSLPLWLYSLSLFLSLLLLHFPSLSSNFYIHISLVLIYPSIYLCLRLTNHVSVVHVSRRFTVHLHLNVEASHSNSPSSFVYSTGGVDPKVAGKLHVVDLPRVLERAEQAAGRRLEVRC